MPTIKPYTSADKADLLAVLALNVPLFFASHECQDFDAYLDKYGDTYFTIWLQNQIVGGAGIIIQKNIGSVTWIFFAPNHTGLGIGTAVMTQFLDFFSTQSHITTLSVRTSQMAYSFFEKFGYKTIKIEKDYWADGFDLYEMEKT